ncbi:Tim44/TimA family putative adaptor protein [Acidisphaera rubrifaciens]|uniref:Mitochondrial import inner membrane translocase subunit Tim44 n=1 Tax=Acidisphaera rubrifaciens HS-AP3 TaxID=1231350 RepID=A0A0D6P4J3_9PROT|nr:Tim44/TimA family putative adaptor protein [Acidisphaera rubrifaciens]GAN76103.1 mitochondrial import inner membrane translocase subunit Tim44 [Acidisphaera rubrifaciens HS-AP3]
MGSANGFPIDLVLFGMIAAFLVLRLRSILGRRTGFERQGEAFRPAADTTGGRKAPVIDARAEPVAPPGRPLPDPAGPVGQTLLRMQTIDRSFTPAGFLAGAEKAFTLIVGAYAEGRRDTLRPLLGPEIFAAFDAAIAAREAAGETQVTEVRAITGASIEAARLHDTHASIDVRFVSDQVSYVRARDGAIASGADAVTELDDIWSFERDLTQRDPTWRLVSARSA